MSHVVPLSIPDTHNNFLMLLFFLRASDVSDKFGDDLEIEVIRDPGTTGNFEVRDLATNELLHSKKAGGDRCESEASKRALAEKISQLMK